MRCPEGIYLFVVVACSEAGQSEWHNAVSREEEEEEEEELLDMAMHWPVADFSSCIYSGLRL